MATSLTTETRKGTGARVHKVVCPHDCPDTCVMTVRVEDGRAVDLGGDPEHRFTQGFLCAKVNRYLERVYSPERILHPLRRVGKKGEGRFARISWDEALEEIAARFRQVIAAHGPQAILPYSYAGNMGLLGYGSLDRRFFQKLGASLLDRTICSSAGGAGYKADRGPGHRLRSRGRGALPVHRGLGRQHRQLERAPLAVRRGGAAARGHPRRHRSLPVEDRRARRSAPRPLPRHRRRAGPRPHARHLPRRPRGPRLPRPLHPGRARAAGAGEGMDAGAHRRHHRPPRGRHRVARARVRDHAARRPSASTTA